MTTAGSTRASTAAEDYTYGLVPMLTTFTHPATIPDNTGAATETSITAATARNPIGNPTSYQLFSGSEGGTALPNSAGLASYTSAAGFRGTDSFRIVVVNDFGTSAPITVTVNVADSVFSAKLTGGAATVGTPDSGTVTFTGGTAPCGSSSLGKDPRTRPRCRFRPRGRMSI